MSINRFSRFKMQEYPAKVIATCLAVMLFTATSIASAADDIIGFRLDVWHELGIQAIPAQSARKFRYSVDPTLSGTDRVLNAQTMKHIGGVLFLEEAHPKSGKVNDCPTVSYDPRKDNGHRLVVQDAAGALGIGTIYDWEIVPVRDFAQSGNHGAMSYMGNYAVYHPAFSDNLVGANLFFLDTSREYGSNFPYIHLTLDRQDIPGYPMSKPSEEAKQLNSQIIGQLGSDHLIFTDEGVNPWFEVNNHGEFLIHGSPYWIAVKDGIQGGNGKILRGISNTINVLNTNPVVYGSAYRVARYAAFFRYLSHHCTHEWQVLNASIDTNRSALNVIRIKEMPHIIQ